MPFQGRSRSGMAFSGPRPGPPPSRSTAGASIDGFQDSFTFGLGDQIKAGFGTLSDVIHGQSAGEAYRRRIAAQHAYDRMDAQQHPTARGWGKGAGAALQLATSGPLGAIARGGARIAEVTPLALRELGVLGAAGAGGGVASQAVADGITHRRSSPADYIAQGVGGSVEALMSRSGLAGRAGAAGAATASVVGDLLHGRMPSGMRAARAASEGAFLGAGAGAVGRKLSNALPRQAKGHWISKEGLGEAASVVRTFIGGDRTISRLKRAAHLPGGGYTLPDQRTLRGKLIESKFGGSADLTPRQKQAYRELGDQYRVDHILPEDVGSLFAYPAVQSGHVWQAKQDSPWPRR